MAKQHAQGPDDKWAAFVRRMDASENGPFTTDFERLLRAGLDLPRPESMDDEAVTSKLWEVIEQLGRMAVVLEWTDHLSDRELYAQLWHHALREEVPDLGEDDDGGVSHVDMVGGGSDEAHRNYLKYYADDETRATWARDFPEFDVPPRESLPYDRDSRLRRLYAWLDAAEDDAGSQ